MDHLIIDAKEMVMEAVALWAGSDIGFVDAWLSVCARNQSSTVCSVNRRDFTTVSNSYSQSNA